MLILIVAGQYVYLYGTDKWDAGNKLILTQSGKVISLSLLFDFAYHNISLLELLPNGALQNALSINTYCFGGSFYPTDDYPGDITYHQGRFYLVGSTYHNSNCNANANFEVLFVKLDANLSIVSLKTFGFTNSVEKAFSIHADGGSIYIGGYTQLYGDKDPFIMKLDTLGNLNDFAVVRIPGSNDSIMDVFVQGSRIYAVGNTNNNILLVVMDTLLNQLSSYRIVLPSSSYASSLEVEGGSIYISGGLALNNGDVLLLILDTLNYTPQAYTYGNTNKDGGFSIKVLPDAILIGGYYERVNVSDGYGNTDLLSMLVSKASPTDVLSSVVVGSSAEDYGYDALLYGGDFMLLGKTWSPAWGYSRHWDVLNVRIDDGACIGRTPNILTGTQTANVQSISANLIHATPLSSLKQYSSYSVSVDSTLACITPIDVDESERFSEKSKLEAYDLIGRWISKPRKHGIYIRSGRKLLHR